MVPQGGLVLVVGAGGGLEQTEFSAAHPDWRFTGIDLSAAMLHLARQTVVALALATVSLSVCREIKTDSRSSIPAYRLGTRLRR